MKTAYVLIGDLAAIALVTWLGFVTHGEAVAAFLPRMAALFFPLAAAWLALAPFFGLFRAQVIADPRQVWRAGVVMLFAAPAAAVVRGLILNAPIVPVFAVVLVGVSALGMLVWRGIVLLLARRRV